MKKVLEWAGTAVLAGGAMVGGALAQEFDGAQPFTVTGLGQMTAQVESGGVSYVCGLEEGEGVAVLTGCLPLVTQEQADQMAALEAQVEELTVALESARAQADRMAAQAQASDAAAAEARAAMEAAEDALAVAEVEIQALRDRLAPFLEADAQAAIDQAMMDRVIVLEQSAMKIALLTDAVAEELLLEALGDTMEALGDRCMLTVEKLDEMGGEDWLNMQVFTRLLDMLDIPADPRDVMLGEAMGNRADPDNPYRAFDRALDETEDFQVRTKAREALDLASSNLFDLDRIAEKAFTNPANITMSDDRSQVTRVGCE